MLNTNKVNHTFSVYTKLNHDEISTYKNLIDIAIKQVVSLLKDDIDFVENESIIHHLAGVFAYYSYILLMQSNNTSEIKMADVTIKSNKNEQLKTAKLIKNDALILAKDIIKDDFIFSAIKNLKEGSI